MNDQDKTQTHVILTQGVMVLHYRIVEKIGAGGMGEVFLAEDTRLKRQVALKLLPPQMTPNEEIHSRFVREAQILAKLNHPNIVGIYDVNEFNSRPFYAMELVDGEVLHQFCHDKPLPVETVIEYAIQICQGLGEAHRAGIIHRDIKASNIIVDKKNRIRLIDFGLAAHDQDDKLTRTGSTLGTVAYMSPEQISGRDIDHRSDLFSLGVVLYELLAGRTPFRRDNEGATLKAIMEDVPEPISRYKSGVPEKLQEIVFQLLEKDKEIRYQSAEGVIADLKRLMYDSQQSYAHMSPKQQPKQSKTGLIAGGVAVVVLVALAIMFKSYFTSSGPGTSSDENSVPMIAVLPFQNLGEAADNYFADGVTDEIASRLSGIEGLGVISRSSSIKYKNTDKSLKQIGKELGIQYVLSGTVRWSKIGDRAKVRITPELIDISEDRNMWADNYERDLTEVFAVQADIAEKIVQKPGVTLVESDRMWLASAPTQNAEAYRLYLRALNAMRRWNENTGNPKSDIDSAVVLDPDFALAHALRAEVYSGRAFDSPSSEDAKIAREAARKALELKPGLAQAHKALGTYYNSVERDYSRALAEFSMAKSELGGDADLLGKIAFVQARQGLMDEAIENLARAAELDPLNPQVHGQLAQYYAFVGDFDRAEIEIDRAISLAPDRPFQYGAKMALTVARYGDTSLVSDVMEEALKHVDTLALVEGTGQLRQYLPDLGWDDLLARKAQTIIDSGYADSIRLPRLYHFYEFSSDSVKIAVYADSARKFIKRANDRTPENPYTNMEYGVVLSQLGECEQALELGERGKELMTVDDCHL